MTARKIDGHWYVDLRIEKKRIRKRSPVDTKRGAQQYEAVLRTRALAGEPLDGSKPEKEVVQKQLTFAEHLDEWLAVYVPTKGRPSEQDTKRSIVNRHLKPKLGHYQLDMLSVLVIDRFKAAQLDAGLSPKTINNQITVLRRSLATAVKWQRIATVPSIESLPTTLPDFAWFEPDEAEDLIEATEREHQAMVMTAIRGGLRRGELQALRWADVNLRRRKISIRRSRYRDTEGPPKNGQPREVPLCDSLLSALRAHRHLRGDYVFCLEDGSPIPRQTMWRIMDRACRRAGLRRLQWHALRHSFASHLVAKGVPLRAVQELLGHSDIRMTMRYAHLAPAHLVDAVAVLDGDGQYLGSRRRKTG